MSLLSPVRGEAGPPTRHEAEAHTNGVAEASMARPDLTPAADLTAHNPVAGDVDDVARDLGVDPDRGLSAEEAASRLASHGPNRLTGGKTEPGWRAFLRQYEDFMQVILLVAALVNQVITGETGT